MDLELALGLLEETVRERRQDRLDVDGTKAYPVTRETGRARRKNA